jgi:hypothetical protein
MSLRNRGLASLANMRSCAGARVIAIDRSRLVNVHFGASQTSPHVEKRQERSFADERRIADFDPLRKFGSEVSMKGVVESPELEGALLHLSYS